MRRLEIEIRPGEIFRATMLEAAPVTNEAVWQALPLEVELRHGSYSGLAMYCYVDFKVGDAEHALSKDVPVGALLLNTQQSSFMTRGVMSKEEIMIVYGPARFFNFTGWFPCNYFAQIDEGDLGQLAAIGERIVRSGVERITFRRVE